MFILGDHLGSTSLVTDSTGAVINQTQYKAWGEERYSSGAKQTNYGYTGQYSYVSDFGLHFYNARWYDSSLGRFTQADSIVPSGIQGYDRYAAMENNPVRYADPTGHMVSDGLVGEGGGCDRQCWNERNKPKSPNGSGDGDSGTGTGGGQCGAGGVDNCPAPPPITTLPAVPSNDSGFVPIYDYSFFPPKVIGYTKTTDSYLNIDFDPNAQTNSLQNFGLSVVTGGILLLVTSCSPVCGFLVAAGVDAIATANDVLSVTVQTYDIDDIDIYLSGDNYFDGYIGIDLDTGEMIYPDFGGDLFLNILNDN